MPRDLIPAPLPSRLRMRAARRAARRSLAATVLSLIAGCSVPASSATRLALQRPAGRAPAAAVLAGHQALLFQAAVLERAAFVRAVLERNPSIEAARLGWRAALARARGAGTLQDPVLDLGVAPLSIGSAQAPFGFAASLSQTLPWFGKRALESAASAAEAEAVASDLEAVERELAFSAVVLYQQYFVAAKSLEINAAHVQLMRALRDAAAAQFSSGRGSAQDGLQAEAELAHLEHDTLLLTTLRDITRAQMNELLHRAPDLALPPAPQQLPPVPELDGDTASLQAGASDQRPEIRAAEQRARAEQARADRAQRELYPDFTLSTSYNSMWDLPAHRWMIGLGFTLPIQTGARAGALEEARALRGQLEAEAARLRAAARTQVFVALQQLEESRHVLALFETRLLPLAERRIDAARASFSASQTPFPSVLEAERSLRALELEYQKARSEQVTRRAELERALGRIPGLDAQGSQP
jgi:cobalt-zinc-cadmium efflux system outer membrane protein